jgi:hypothetical protein
MSAVSDTRQPSLTSLAAVVDAATDPLTQLEALRELTAAVQGAVAAAVADARAQRAWWAEVATRLAVTRQSAHRRFAEPARREETDDEVVERPPRPQPAVEWELRTLGPRGGIRVGRVVGRR